MQMEEDFLQDYSQAYFWLCLAHQNGIIESKNALTILIGSMTPQQIEAGKQLIKNWKLQEVKK